MKKMSKRKNSKTTKKILKAKKLYSVNINGEFAVTNKKGAKALLKLMRDANYERYDTETEKVPDELSKTSISSIPERFAKYLPETKMMYGHYDPRKFKSNPYDEELNAYEEEKISLDTIISDNTVYGEFMVNELFGVYQQRYVSAVYDMSVFKFPKTPAVLVVNSDADEFPGMKLGVRIEDTIVVTDYTIEKYTKLTVPTRKKLVSFVQEICSLNGYPTRNPINLCIQKRATNSGIPLHLLGVSLLNDSQKEESEEHDTSICMVNTSEVEESINKGTFYGKYGNNRIIEIVDKDQTLVDVNHMHPDINQSLTHECCDDSNIKSFSGDELNTVNPDDNTSTNKEGNEDHLKESESGVQNLN